MKFTACPLDCYDACEVKVTEGGLKGSTSHKITNGKLCKLFGYLQNEQPIKTSLSLKERLSKLVSSLITHRSSLLYYKGSGNMGVMQNSTKLFFEKYGATFASGSLCDGAGAAGIEEGRGDVINPKLENLTNSDIIIVWGRNLTVTSPHIYRLIKDKTFITIDPVCTEIARKSELHIQIKPKTDHLLAKNLTKLYLEDSDDKYGFLKLIKNKKVAILVGIGVQKYIEGAKILRSIDSFAATLGVFNKDAGGIWYLSNSTYGYNNPFMVKPKHKIPKPKVNFGDFELCFIQGANPVVTAPNKAKVIEGLKKSFVVFFGTVNNETCKYANLIIPAKTFLQKKDIRLSYSHDEVVVAQKIEENNNAISEYELTKFLFDTFNMCGLKDQDELISNFIDKEIKKPKVDNFKFIEEIEIGTIDKKENEFYLITCKSKNSLNSQFKTDDSLYIHPSLGFKDGNKVKAITKVGNAVFKIKTTPNLRKDCCLIHSGAKNVNYLTPDNVSEKGENAVYQEVVVELQAITE